MDNIFNSPFAAEMLWAGLAMTGLGMSGAVMPVQHREGEGTSADSRIEKLRSLNTPGRS
jgi:hypothetical protein